MEKWTQLTKKQQWVIVAVSAGLVCGGTFGAYQAYGAHQQTVARQTLEKQLSVLEKDGELTTAIADLEDPQGYLAEELTQDTIDQLQKKLVMIAKATDSYDKLYYKSNDDKMELQEINALDIQQGNLRRIRKKFMLQGKVNSLFHGTALAIDGSEVRKDVIIADRTTRQTIEELALSDQSFEDDKWLESITNLVNEANAQLEGITKADKAVDACYKDKKVDPKVTKQSYETADQAVKSIKRAKDKERLSKKLVEIKKVVDANEKKAKEQAEKEKAEKAAQAATEAESSSGGNSAGSSGGSGNGGGGSNNNNNGGNSTPPTTPQPEKPYPLIPYTGSGTLYYSYSQAAAAGEKWLIEAPISAEGSYTIYTEVWSDGSERYYLELY